MTGTNRPLPRVRIAIALCAVVWGVWSIACGSNENTEADPPPTQNERYQPPVSNRVPTEGGEVAGPDAPVPAADTASSGATELPPANAATPEVPVVRFAVDEAGLLMGLPMQPYAAPAGSGAMTTSAAQSGDWLVDNFVYRGSQLDVVSEGVPESVIVTMRHRQADASLVMWSRPLSAVEGERYLDVLADELVATVATTPAMLDLAWPDAVPMGSIESSLRGLAMSETQFAGRAALQVDLLREHPTTRMSERVRLRVVRQATPSGPVLVLAALRTRSGDFGTLYTALDDVLGGVELAGEALESGVNPRRDLTSVAEDYGFEMKPIPPDPGGTRATAARADRMIRGAVAAAVRATLGTALGRTSTEAPNEAGPGEDEPLEPPARERPPRGL